MTPKAAKHISVAANANQPGGRTARMTENWGRSGRRNRPDRLTGSQEQFGVGSAAHEHDQAAFARIVECVNQQKITADVTFTMSRPVTRQRVVKPFGWQWPVIGDKQHHDLFQPVHVVPAGVGQALPVLEKVLGVVRRAGQVCPLTCGWLLRGHSAGHQRLQNERDGS